MRRSNFRKVWAVATSAQFGYWFSSIAFQWIVAQATGNSAIVLGFLYFVMLLPILLLSIPAGVLADRFDRRRIVIVCQSAIVVISLTTAALIHWGPPPLPALLLCGFAVGTAHSVATPAYTSLVADSVPSRDLPSAVPLQAIGMNLARILGPMLAGAIIFFGGEAASLLVYGLFGLLGLIVILRVPNGQLSRVAPPPDSMRGHIRDGFSHARRHPPAGVALAIVAVCSLFAASYLAQLPVLAANSTEAQGAFVFLTSAGGVGSLIGVLLVATRASSNPSVTPAAVMLLVMAVVVAMLGYGPPIGWEMALVGTAGGLQFAIMTTCNRVIQQVVYDTHRGRVMSLYAITWGGLLPIGGLWLGLLIATAGIAIAFTVNGLIVGVFALWVLRPTQRRVGITAYGR